MIDNYHGVCLDIPSKFSKVIPKGYKLFSFIKKDHHFKNYYSIVFYINKVTVDLDNYFFDLETITDLVDSIGHIETCLDINADVLQIRYLEVNNKYKHMGIASYFMIAVSSYVKNIVSKMELDDMTDFAHEKDCLYQTLGLKYINPKPEPEMEGKTKVVSNKWNNFCKKYSNRKIKFFQL